MRRVACLILFTTAALKLAGLVEGGRVMLLSPDPLLDLPTWVLLLVMSVVEVTLAVLLIAPRCSDGNAGTLLVWFTVCSAFYRMGHSVSTDDPCPCLGLLPRLLLWSTQATNFISLSLLVILAFAGVLLLRNGRQPSAGGKA